MFYCLYRLSDNSNIKTKLENANKFDCLNSFIKEFGKEDLMIIADNCRNETILKLQEHGIKYEESYLGNARAYLNAINYAINNFQDDDIVYLAEDDYLYLPNSKKILLEGIEIADYVTLYDHPDKYMLNGPNPLVKDGGEKTKVYLTKSAHWKETNSTTLTYAARVKTLKEDLKLWNHYGINDFSAFRVLTHNFLNNQDAEAAKDFNVNKRKLISSIPGYSTHCETALLSPLTDWTRL